MASSAPPPASTAVLQTMGKKQMRFDAGTAALQLRTTMQGAPLWLADLWRCAWAMLVVGVAAAVLVAYAVAAVDSSAWPLATMQAFFVLSAAGWLAAAVMRTRRLLEWALYADMACTILAGGALMLWMTVFQELRADAAWLWWTVLGVEIAQLLVSLAAEMALANLLDARLIADAHACFRKVVGDNAVGQRRRGDDGDGVREPRVESGAHALTGAGEPAAAAALAKKLE